MAKSMNEKLQKLKEDNEEKAMPAEERVEVADDGAVDGTDVSVGEVQTADEKDAAAADALRPKPVPKKNRRGSKQMMAELEAAKELAEGNKEKYTRLLAEFDNARARFERENAAQFDMGMKAALEKMLPIVDNFERALDAIPEEQKNDFSNGVEMIYKQFIDTFAAMGAAPMNCAGEQFDPNFHNAVMHVEDENYGENVVVEEMQKGYMYKDSVLRHAMVKVAN